MRSNLCTKTWLYLKEGNGKFYEEGWMSVYCVWVSDLGQLSHPGVGMYVYNVVLSLMEIWFWALCLGGFLYTPRGKWRHNSLVPVANNTQSWQYSSCQPSLFPHYTHSLTCAYHSSRGNPPFYHSQNIPPPSCRRISSRDYRKSQAQNTLQPAGLTTIAVSSVRSLLCPPSTAHAGLWAAQSVGRDNLCLCLWIQHGVLTHEASAVPGSQHRPFSELMAVRLLRQSGATSPATTSMRICSAPRAGR